MTPSPRNATFAILSSCPRVCAACAPAIVYPLIATGGRAASTAKPRPPTAGVVLWAARRLSALTRWPACLCWVLWGGRSVARQGSGDMAVTKEDVLAALAAVPGPDGTPLPRTGKLSDIVVTDGKVFFSITVDATVVQSWDPVRKAAETAVRAIPGVASALVALTGERPAGGARLPAVPGVGAIIAVASGKGGVGKSTTAVNLALGLRDLGLKVGMLDADIYGPSVPKLLAIKGKPEMLGGTKLRPMDGYGLKVMSIGFLVEEETPMIWRGPMVISALTQML